MTLSGEPVEAPQDLDGLGTQLAVDRAPVGLGELAHAVVELGVADLAVLGLLGRLELRAHGVLAGPGLARPPERHGDDDDYDCGEENQCQSVFHAEDPRAQARARRASLPRTQGRRVEALRA